MEYSESNIKLLKSEDLVTFEKRGNWRASKAKLVIDGKMTELVYSYEGEDEWFEIYRGENYIVESKGERSWSRCYRNDELKDRVPLKYRDLLKGLVLANFGHVYEGD